MKRKVIMLCGVLLLSCGCTAVVDVDLSNDKVIEKLAVTGQTEEEQTNLKQYNFYTPAYFDEQGSSLENVKIDGVEYYDISHQNDLNFSYAFPQTNYHRSSLAHYCYENISYQKQGMNLLLSTSKKFNCFEIHPDLNEVKVNVRIPEGYELVSTNTKQTSGTTLSWILTKDAKDNSIFLSLKKKESSSTNSSSTVDKDSEKQEDEQKNSKLALVLVGIVGFVVVLFVVIKINKKKNGF